MKYAIYDKAADGYLTKMEFEVGYSEHTKFECGYNELITKAHLLDTKEAADSAIANIEGFKFMEKGRFVVHCFDDTLKEHYIISESGTPTKVVESITVDLDGTINVKYGTMISHWSTASLDYAINRMNALQKAKDSRYTAWCNTFDIYKVIKAIDEKGFVNYQFIKVTEKGLDNAKEEADPINKRIEELEKANYKINKAFAEQAVIITEIRVKNTNLKTKVESIKKEAHNWKKLYENADSDRLELKNVIDIIYNDLKSSTADDDLKCTLNALSHNSGLDHISMPTKVSYILDNGNCLTAKDEICAIIDQVITIMDSRELNQSVAFSSAEEVDRAKKLADAIIDICEATDEKFEVTLNKFSQLYEGINYSSDNDDVIVHAFKSILLIFSKVDSALENVIDANVELENEVKKAKKALDDQKKLNDANKATIARMVVEKRDMDKKVSNAADWLEEVNDKNEGLINMLKEITDFIADIMAATLTPDDDTMISNLRNTSCKMGIKTIDDGPIYGVSVILNSLIRIIKEGTDWKRRAEEAICDYTKCNEALGEWKRKYLDMRKNRDMALERAEKFKGIANSVYGMTIPGRCNGKQTFCDIATGKKILVDKEKYDDLMECVNNISLTYEMMKLTPFSMDCPSWLSGIINRINNLTK